MVAPQRKREETEWNMTMAKHGEVTDIANVIDRIIKWPLLSSIVPASVPSLIKRARGI